MVLSSRLAQVERLFTLRGRVDAHMRGFAGSSDMQLFLMIVFSPIVWSLAFVWPLLAQMGMASGVSESETGVWVVSALIALAFGLMAQFRGSWIWLK